MGFDRASAELDAAYEGAQLDERRRLASEARRIGIDPTERDGGRRTAVASARRVVADEPAVRSGEGVDPFARTLQALAERRRCDREGLGRLRRCELEDLAQHVREPMRAIEAREL